MRLVTSDRLSEVLRSYVNAKYSTRHVPLKCFMISHHGDNGYFSLVSIKRVMDGINVCSPGALRRPCRSGATVGAERGVRSRVRFYLITSRAPLRFLQEGALITIYDRGSDFRCRGRGKGLAMVRIRTPEPVTTLGDKLLMTASPRHSTTEKTKTYFVCF